MKTRKMPKKLRLNKKTITHLNVEEMTKIRGRGGSFLACPSENEYCSALCIPTYTESLCSWLCTET